MKFWASSKQCNAYLFPLVYWQVQRNLWPHQQTTQTMSAGKHTEKKISEEDEDTCMVPHGLI